MPVIDFRFVASAGRIARVAPIQNRNRRVNFTSSARFRSSGKPTGVVSRLSVSTMKKSLPGWYSHLKRMFVQGAQKTWELSAFTVRMLGRIVTGDASLRNISGPLTMADLAGQSAQAGPLVFVSYLALISISLGVLNLLPVPLLDGGHLLYYLAELVKGSPVSDRAFEVGQRIGMAMLAVLIALALFNDVSRLF